MSRTDLSKNHSAALLFYDKNVRTTEQNLHIFIPFCRQAQICFFTALLCAGEKKIVILAVGNIYNSLQL